jgi:enolase
MVEDPCAEEVPANYGALIKPNQVGTLSEAHDALLSCPIPIASSRSGETEDTCIVDLALGWQASLIEVGSVARGERTDRWNRGLRIRQAQPMPLQRFLHPGSI